MRKMFCSVLLVGVLLMGGSFAQEDEAAWTAMAAYPEQPTVENASRLLGSLPLNEENATYMQGFCSQLIRQHSNHLQQLLEEADAKHSAALRLLICISCWLADTEESNRMTALTLEYDPIMAAWSKIKPTSEKPDFTKLENLSSCPLEAMCLDMAWGAYDATRSRDILCSFLRCATRSSAPEQPFKLWFIPEEAREEVAEGRSGQDRVAMAAKWSVTSRAQNDPDFASELQACLETLPEAVRARWAEPLPDSPMNEHEYSPNPE